MYSIVGDKGKNKGGVRPSDKTMKLKYECGGRLGRKKTRDSCVEVHLARVRYRAVLGGLAEADGRAQVEVEGR